MTTKNFEEYRIDNLKDLSKPEVATEVLDIIDSYLEVLELLFDGFKLLRQLIMLHQKKHGDKFIRGFQDREKLMIPVLITAFNKSNRFDLGDRTNDLYVKVGRNVKSVALISMQVEKLVDEAEYSIRLILISTFGSKEAIEQVEDLIDSFESSIDNLKEIISVPKAVLFESKASLN